MALQMPYIKRSRGGEKHDNITRWLLDQAWIPVALSLSGMRFCVSCRIGLGVLDNNIFDDGIIQLCMAMNAFQKNRMRCQATNNASCPKTLFLDSELLNIVVAMDFGRKSRVGYCTFSTQTPTVSAFGIKRESIRRILGYLLSIWKPGATRHPNTVFYMPKFIGPIRKLSSFHRN